MELVVRGGTVVTPGTVSVTDIGIDGGRVVQLGGPMTGDRELDARGRTVVPGGIDGHVHLTPTGTGPNAWHWADDFASGTAAALAGGITTIGNMCHPDRGEVMFDAVNRDTADGEAKARCDFFLHPILMEPTASEVDALEELSRLGHTSVKIFLSFRRFDRSVSGYLDALRRAAAIGSLALLHCEDIAIMDCCCQIMREEGRTHPRYFAEGRPVAAERAATERAVAMSEVTGCPVYVETRPIYLFLTKERFDEQDGAKYTGAPPLRDPADVAALWAGIAQGTVATVATDHAPWRLAEKLDPALDATDMRLGMAELETMLPMLWWAGVRSGRISLSRFVEVTSTNPAKLFGLYPRKGTITVGADADLVIWDDGAKRRIDGSSMQSQSDFSPYDGWEVTGWPAVVLSRGDVVAEAGSVTGAPGRGRLVSRGRTQRL